MTSESSFEWGVATAAYQIEGAAQDGGRTPSIWDQFCSLPGGIADGTSGAVATNHYHRIESDLDLIAGLGVQAYRFSLSWPRLIPRSDGYVNPDGVAFYRRILAGLRERGVLPVVTLYHWDLPLYLHEIGGWQSRAIVDAFEHYAKICFEEFGTDVHRWCTINEPWCVSILGYGEGIHAPGIKDRTASWQVAHHLLLAHGRAVRAHAKSRASESEIGIVLNLQTPRPATASAADREAVDLSMDERNLLFLNPLSGNPYPERLFRRFPDASPPVVEPGDFEIIATPTRFVGLNYYDEYIVQAPKAPTLAGWEFAPSWTPSTDMGWPLAPSGLKRQLEWVAPLIAQPTSIIVAENGVAVSGGSSDEKSLTDWSRIGYLESHIRSMERARASGVPVVGYYCWTLMDNFEWALGLSKRFGLVHVDYQTLERTPRASYYYYRDRITNGPRVGEDVPWALHYLSGQQG